MGGAVTAVVTGERTRRGLRGEHLRRRPPSPSRADPTRPSGTRCGRRRRSDTGCPRPEPARGSNGAKPSRTAGADRCAGTATAQLDRRTCVSGRAIRLLAVWHAVGVVAGFVGLLLASRSGDDELPWMPRYVAAGLLRRRRARATPRGRLGIRTTTRWSRPASARRQLPARRRRRRRRRCTSSTRSGPSATSARGCTRRSCRSSSCWSALIVVLRRAAAAWPTRPTAADRCCARSRSAGPSPSAAGVWFVIVADPTGMLADGSSTASPGR